jgi:hypothetical protein
VQWIRDRAPEYREQRDDQWQQRHDAHQSSSARLVLQSARSPDQCDEVGDQALLLRMAAIDRLVVDRVELGYTSGLVCVAGGAQHVEDSPLAMTSVFVFTAATRDRHHLARKRIR